MILPSLNAIRVFETAARLGSLKDAAEELGLTPSAVSRHIRSLEDALGTQLFVRGFREVTLSPRGAYYARRLSEAFRVIETATEETAVESIVRQGKGQRVTLSSEPAFMSLWLADRLSDFRRLHPDVEFDVSTEAAGENPRADFSIVVGDEDPVEPSLELLLPVHIAPVCAPSLLAKGPPLNTPADLAQYRLLHESTTTWWEEWFSHEGLTDINARSGAIFHDPTLVIREAVNGGGVALADTITSQDLLARGLLTTPFPWRQHIATGYYLRQKPGAGRRKLGARLFREWLLAEIGRHKREMKIS